MIGSKVRQAAVCKFTLQQSLHQNLNPSEKKVKFFKAGLLSVKVSHFG